LQEVATFWQTAEIFAQVKKWVIKMSQAY